MTSEIKTFQDDAGKKVETAVKKFRQEDYSTS